MFLRKRNKISSEEYGRNTIFGSLCSFSSKHSGRGSLGFYICAVSPTKPDQGWERQKWDHIQGEQNSQPAAQTCHGGVQILTVIKSKGKQDIDLGRNMSRDNLSIPNWKSSVEPVPRWARWRKEKPEEKLGRGYKFSHLILTQRVCCRGQGALSERQVGAMK